MPEPRVPSRGARRGRRRGRSWLPSAFRARDFVGAVWYVARAVQRGVLRMTTQAIRITPMLSFACILIRSVLPCTHGSGDSGVI